MRSKFDNFDFLRDCQKIPKLAIFDSIRSGRPHNPTEAVSLTRKLDQNDRLTVEVGGAVARVIREHNLFFEMEKCFY